MKSRDFHRMELRKRGARRAPPPAIRPSAAYQEKEQYVSREQMEALQALYTSSPAIAAVREVLRGELFRGGLCLKRDGKDVKLTQKLLPTRFLVSRGLYDQQTAKMLISSNQFVSPKMMKN